MKLETEAEFPSQTGPYISFFFRSCVRKMRRMQELRPLRLCWHICLRVSRATRQRAWTIRLALFLCLAAWSDANAIPYLPISDRENKISPRLLHYRLVVVLASAVESHLICRRPVTDRTRLLFRTSSALSTWWWPGLLAREEEMGKQWQWDGCSWFSSSWSLPESCTFYYYSCEPELHRSAWILLLNIHSNAKLDLRKRNGQLIGTVLTRHNNPDQYVTISAQKMPGLDFFFFGCRPWTVQGRLL